MSIIDRKEHTYISELPSMKLPLIMIRFIVLIHHVAKEISDPSSIPDKYEGIGLMDYVRTAAGYARTSGIYNPKQVFPINVAQ
ncbi:hypothetical protein [Peribacillus sp. SCS-155]|uniref:hypothetical protein n=1 Tax=Peribacillus sedimenti TaxID=3115297 RepID=UPI0039069181